MKNEVLIKRFGAYRWGNEFSGHSVNMEISTSTIYKVHITFYFPLQFCKTKMTITFSE